MVRPVRLARLNAVPPAPARVVITTASVNGGIVGLDYSFTLAAAGTGTVQWKLKKGVIPPGLSFNGLAGTITGVPTTVGLFDFILRAQDSAATTASQAYSLIISPSDSNYGNVGSVYASEGGARDPAAIALTACQPLATNTSYFLRRSLAAATPGTICFPMGANAKLDLGGNTLTGRVVMTRDPSGIHVFNGTIHCTWPDIGSNAGCIRLDASAAVSATVQIHHLTVTNDGVPSRGIHVSWPVTTAFAGRSLRIYNTTVLVPSQPNVSRSFALSILGKNQTVEVFSNDLTCAADANACQGVMCYGVLDCKLHHNNVHMIENTTSQNGRGLLFDSTGNGESWNNIIDTNNNRAVRIRDSFNVRVHDNVLHNIRASASAAIHLADPDVGGNDLNALIDNNTFEMIDGTVFFNRDGFNVIVRNNTITCAGECLPAAKLADIRGPQHVGSRTEMEFDNNPTVLLLLTPPQIAVTSGAKVTVSNSGIAAGTGTIINLGSCP